MVPSEIYLTAVSKLTSKYQAIIPKKVRDLLSLQAGDRIAFEIEKGEVRLRKAGQVDLAHLSSIESGLSEWSSAADSRGYDDL